MTITLERTDDLPLQFEGHVVAEASSRDPGKDRWTTLALWLLEGGKGYVVEVVGVSTLPGETTRRSAHHCPTVKDVLAVLRKSDNRSGVRRSYLPDIAWSLVDDARRAGALVLPEAETV